MLWPTGEALNGSHVSQVPVLRSTRCTPPTPLFCVQILPSTSSVIGLVILTCEFARFNSGGRLQTCIFSVLGSNFMIAPWYIMPAHRLPSLSVRSDRSPCGEPFFGSGTGYSVTLPVLGSSLPIDCSPKLEYHAMPSGSRMTSCGSINGRGRSYSVYTTCVALPLGRGNVLSG